LVIFSVTILYNYRNYADFTSSKYYEDRATVLLQYKKFSEKKGREYTVLKLKSKSGFSYYTVSWDELKNIQGKEVQVGLITSGISFREFMSSFFAINFKISLLPSQNKNYSISNYFAAQHTNEITKDVFGALFLGEGVGKELRESITKWGIAHLFALSGFHLGLLGGIIFFTLYYPYLFLQKRYFRSRNRNFDLFIISAVLLFWYLIFTGSPPSLLRSFVMLFIGGLLYFWHMKIFSFEFLGWLLVLLLALFPHLFFSIGFWLSFGGVFFIYMFLHYFAHLRTVAFIFWLNIYIFISMLPFVHLFFGVYSPWSLLSPFLSIVFVVFYILELVFHIVGLGGVLDGYIVWFLDIPIRFIDFRIDIYLFVVYMFISFGAIFYKKLFYLQIGSATLFLIFLNYRYFALE